VTVTTGIAIKFTVYEIFYSGGGQAFHPLGHMEYL